ncbi:MAG: carboxypeptidase-like regulatory domain-containing protein [Muribaculaceae bacterium]|nr:carboxypeptidase-like regulatory domain-containing protein [Muribaculaceae bacterium]
MKNLFLAFALMLGIMTVTSCSSDLDEHGTTGNISGSVSDMTTGEPVSTVNVTLAPGGKSTVTGSDGSFSFENLEPGTYTVEISKEGYTPANSKIIVRAGETTPAHLLIGRLTASLTADKSLLEFGDQVQTLSFTIVNRSYQDLEYVVEIGSCDWLSVKPENGKLKYGKTETIVVNLIRELLPMGMNEAMVVVRSLNGDGNAEVKVIAVNGNSTATVNTLETTNITSSKATLNGEVINIGEPKYTERGFVYSTNSTPTTENCIQKLSCPVNEDAAFSCNIENLETLKTYYARSYVVQEGSLIYGNIVSFTTSQQTTEISTSAATNVGANTATLNGSIIKAGIPAFNEKGFCYSNRNSVPDISDHRESVAGTATGKFSLQLNTLEYPSTYYARAYAIQGGGVIYGNVVSFKTSGEEAVVSTSAVTDVAASTATFNGMVRNQGTPPYTERGFCFSKNSNPSISSNKVRATGSGTGAFSAQVSNLDYPANYYVCAYVMQGGEPVYGNIVSFSTETREANVRTSAATEVSTNSATLNGIITDLGIPAATRRGFVYSSTTSNPTISNDHVDDYLVNTAAFKKNITGLSGGTTYYARAYAYQDGDYIYGNSISFTTSAEPSVRTDAPTNLSKSESMFSVSWSVTFNGSVLTAGNPAYSQKGFVYGTSYDPTPSSGTAVTVSGTGTGKFSKSVSNLQDMQTYYVRAFVKVGNKYYYGETERFYTY